ncbi:MAG: orotate phosphoribosyltransferase [Bacteroidetes bacterium RIFOXYB2_FULL_35_7]|nr:MAG: orotate phosphoribosyltransferase [Bacteroidetes bacterium GWF2_35_48]OFY92218.1 MAG: orotate phosphoribosyltransferase [Bacteroidetes bacterium RIFOXYB2_FULL_35_7]HBX49929.1 orotate phosphoribosyltransferase [Bacteroidales bacterium]
MNAVNKKIAEYLLQIKAIKLQPAKPFTWASGWHSPIYCDNRKTLSYPDVRDYIKNTFADVVRTNFPETEVIAGVATGAIAHGALVAQELGLPFVYVRSAPKEHGMENLIEGEIPKNKKVVVIEDLISTGGSSLKAVDALRHEACDVLGMAAIFSYEFPNAKQNFSNANCKLITLSNYSSLIDFALETGFISQNDVQTLRSWREAPESWGK